MHNVTPFCFTDKNKTVSRFESRFNLLKYRTLHNNTTTNKNVSHNINLMFHDIIFYKYNRL